MPHARARLVEAIGRRGVDFVAQEAVTLVDDAGLGERPARAAAVQPAAVAGARRRRLAASCRAASSASPTISTPAPSTCSRAAAPADAWMLSDKPVAQTTLLPTPDRITINRATGALPSRAAANLFWLGRYVERTEATLRLVRALVNRATESTQTERDVNADIVALLGALGGGAGGHAERPAGARRRRGACSSAISTGALPFLVGAAQSAASVIRDRFSPDAWRALTDLVEMIRAPFEQGPSESAIFERVNGALRILAVVLRPRPGEHEPTRRLALP